MTDTPHLALPLIAAAQADKHVTHNEALARLDALVHLAVLDRDLAAPPASPAEGDRYLVPAGATGAWAGKAGSIAAFQAGGWVFLGVRPGFRLYVADEKRLIVHDGTGFVTAGEAVNPAALVGVNTTAAAPNRLAVKSDAVLLSHDDVTPGSGDVRVVVNKQAPGRTASFLFQTAWSGRAEFGTTGDDKVRLKTSPNGTTWTDAVTVDPATGWIGFGTSAPEGPLHLFRGLTHPLIDRVDDASAAPTLSQRKARGTLAAKTAVVTGDVVQAFYGQAFDGTAYIPCANLRWSVEGTVSAGTVPTMVEFWTFTAGTGFFRKFEVTSAGHARPSADNVYTLGDATNRWAAVHAANGTIQTSDARDKRVEGDLGFAARLVDRVDPVLFRWKVGGREMVASETETRLDEDGRECPAIVARDRPGRRLHAGFRAQTLKAAMDAEGVDFGAWGLDDPADPESRQWTRPDQLVAVLWAALKETRADLARLKAAAAATA